MAARLRGADGEIPPFLVHVSNATREAGQWTVSGGRFDWGGRLLKSNGGVRRFSRPVWKAGYECKGKREPDCETNKSSRYESRS